MSSEPWCEYSDLPKSGCAHCRNVPELDGADGRPELDPAIIVARKDGKCPECHQPIVAGEDHIGRVKHECGQFDEQPCACWRPWVHYGCGR